jgi:hypothetical protein
MKEWNPFLSLYGKGQWVLPHAQKYIRKFQEPNSE